MNLLDMRTVIVSYALSTFVCMIVMAVLWYRYRRRFAGLGFWLVDFIMQFIALALLAMRGLIPEIFSMATGYPMILGGTIIMALGLERFTGKRTLLLSYCFFLAIYILVHEYFAFAVPSLAWRNIAFSAAMVIVCIQCAWLLLGRVGRLLRPVTAGTGFVFAVFSLISIARIFIDTLIPVGNDFFHSNIYDTLILILYQFFFIVLTFSISLMINRRLFAILENDMAGRDQAERIVRLRLKLWEYATGHTMGELMQEALDEIEALTGSLIGFYHFVEEDKNTLTLQDWSTRTRRDFCSAEGEGMHYSIDQAGVWADCVRERRPIIHNDYASLPGRRGLPAGHAHLERELVVPTLRDNRVVSVLGVGNKPAEYDESDVVLVSYIADLVWTIVTQKRADEQILGLNEKLEHLAMTDELTGLANRRSFFIQGKEEIKRSRRYGTPLAMLMLDIDKFKDINDNYGHDAGDRTLKCAGQTLIKAIRDVDVPARLGGEEFGILLPNTKAADALKLAERLRLAIQNARCSSGETEIPAISVSIGVAALGAGTPDIDALLKNADIAMYQAKREGRNRVCFQD